MNLGCGQAGTEEQGRHPQPPTVRTPTGLSEGGIYSEGFFPPHSQPNTLAETGRLDLVHVGERLHNNRVRCTVLVLIPKVNEDTRWIELIEVVWKVVEAVIDARIKTVVQCNDVLYGFCKRRGMGTAIMEIKLAQELASVYQYALFLKLIYIKKAYNNLDCGWLLQILAGYGAVPKMWGILA